MGVYEDMASDAGYKYGTDENKQLATAIEEQERRNQAQWEAEEQERRNQAQWEAEEQEQREAEALGEDANREMGIDEGLEDVGCK